MNQYLLPNLDDKYAYSATMTLEYANAVFGSHPQCNKFYVGDRQVQLNSEASSNDYHQALNLLRESLPYLVKTEYGPSTSIVLRSLIKDIESVVNHAGRS